MLRDGEARTYKVLQKPSGRTVLLHQLWVERTPPHQPDLTSLVLAFLRRATVDEMEILVDMGEEAGRVFVVTEDLPICQDLRRWLQAPGKPAVAGKASVPKSAPSADFDVTAASRGLPWQVSQDGLGSPDATLLFTTPNVLQPPVASPPPSQAADEPGEFTSVFLGSPQPSRVHSEAEVKPSEKPSLTPLAPEPPSQLRGPGEFTRLFQAQQVEEKPPAAPFVEAEPSQPLASPVQQSPASPPSAVGPQGPGEFTLLFRPGAAATQPAGPPIPASSPKPMGPLSSSSSRQGPGELTQLFQGYQPGKSAPAPPAFEQPETVVPPPPPNVDQAKPGAFTLLFQQPSEPVPPSMPYVQPPASPSPMGPQPQLYQMSPPPQFQQPAAAPAFTMAPQPVMPQMPPMAVPTPVAPQAGPPKPGKGKFLVPLIILGGLFLIAVALILVFAFKH